MAGSGIREEKLYNISIQMSKLEEKKKGANEEQKKIIQAKIEDLENNFKQVMNPALFKAGRSCLRLR